MVANTPIKCIQVSEKRDQRGTVDGHLIKFIVGVEGHHDNVTVHLHHTQRKVQVQGRGTLWFVDQVLKERFLTAARNKSFNISDINKKIGQISSNKKSTLPKDVQSCGFCHKAFKSNAKPSECTKCLLKFHRTKQLHCFSLHQCVQRIPLTSHPPPLASHSPPLPSNQAVQEQTLSVSPPDSDSFGSGLGTSSASSEKRPNQGPSAISSEPLTSSREILPNFSNSSDPIPPPVQARNKKTKKNNSPALTKDEAEIEYLKIELNNTRTRIVQLDSEIETFKKKITILNTRIKILSDRENDHLHAEYFPENGPRQNSFPSSKTSHCPPHHSCPHYCCQHTTQPCCGPHSKDMKTTTISEAELDLIKRVNEMSNQFKIIRETLDSLANKFDISPSKSHLDSEACHSSQTHPPSNHHSKQASSSKSPLTSSSDNGFNFQSKQYVDRVSKHPQPSTSLPHSSSDSFARSSLSPADIEEFFFESDDPASLNSKVLTNQL